MESVLTSRVIGSTIPSVTEEDHIDRFLREHGEHLPAIDFEVEAIVDRLNGLGRRIHRLLDETLTEIGIDHGDWKILRNLRFAGPPYRQTPGELAADVELSTGAMTNRLDRLERAGLVRRLPDANDRRSVQVELTEKGGRIWEDSVVAQAAKESVVASALSRTEMERLNALLRKLMLAFEADAC
jgi:DNA-binding MarR family transcriptional regulator